ncbi:MAG: DUF5611 family protein [Methanomicrobiales archaeon]|nr:DUF5611 family protein [Methanomicrobiales archaeon]
MQEYPVKRTHVKNLQKEIGEGLRELFGVEPVQTGDGYTISYGALKQLTVRIGDNGKTLVLETESDASATDEEILDTNRRFRRYLERVTGYSTKERVKLSKKDVEG